MCPLGNGKYCSAVSPFNFTVEGMRAMCPLGNSGGGFFLDLPRRAAWRECGLCARLETYLFILSETSRRSWGGGNAGYVPAWKLFTPLTGKST